VNDRFAIEATALSPETRRRVDRDARLLLAWWLAVGLVATVLLHRVGGVRSPLWRYPLTAALMYLLGNVAALRAWLSSFARAVWRAPLRWRIATERERTWQPRVSRRTLAFAAGFVTALTAGALTLRILMRMYDDFALGVIAAFVVLLLVAFVVQWLPQGSSSATLMTELAIDFVFGRFLGRRDALPPRPRRESLATIVGETWPRGVALLVFATVAAAALVLLRPGAESLADAFR
jgi:hypothetical protein